jgi:CheY-like chemotaxis protein
MTAAPAPMRVVIADDEEDIRLLLSLQMAEAGFAVVGLAADGREALAMCADEPPDAVVLDLLMPGMNGFEVIPRLQRDHPGVGIVAYTAVAGDFVRREMARLRIPLVLKSGDPTALMAAVVAAASVRRGA